MTDPKRRSKRRSHTKESPKELHFFVDECLEITLVLQALRDAKFSLTPLTQRFHPGTADLVWMPAIAKDGWLVLSKDKFKKDEGRELAMIARAKLGVFVLSRAHLSVRQTADALTGAKKRMEACARRQQRPFVAHVGSDGTVRVVQNAKALQRLLRQMR